MYETANALITYVPETGKFYWKQRDEFWIPSAGRRNHWNNRFAFKECFFTVDANGYRIGSLLNKNYYAHRVAWLLTHGEWPEHEIDHINGVRGDNRLVNLRSVTSQENGKNQGMKVNNTSGVVGVIWDKRQRKWVARIRTMNIWFRLGSFATKAEAVAARQAAEIAFGFHPNHGLRPSVPEPDYRRPVKL